AAQGTAGAAGGGSRPPARRIAWPAGEIRKRRKARARASCGVPRTTPPDWRIAGWLAAGRSLAPGLAASSVQDVMTASALPVEAYWKAWRTSSPKTALG